MCKYVFVCGSIISGCGKGVAAASLALLLRLRNHRVTMIKCDPYLNVNAGIIRPSDHGEVWLCDDGAETDLDLGHYFRIAGINVGQENICTSGTLYKELIEEQEEGKYLGETVQICPHITDKIKKRLLDLGKDQDVVIVEIGGCVSDSESFAFFEATRELKRSLRDDVLIAMVAPILWVPTIMEFKTKPLQNGVKDLQRQGLQPDVIFCRTDRDVPEKILNKVADSTNVERDHVFLAPDVSSIYQVPIEFYNRHVDDLFVDLFRLKRSSCRIQKYRDLVEKHVTPGLPEIEIGVFGKYDNCDEAYISIKEALVHAATNNNVRVKVRWLKAEDLEKYKDLRGVAKYFDGLSGVVCPGGFGVRGVEGKIRAIQYCREKQIPFLGICLGLQCAVIEFARNVCDLEGVNSLEFDPEANNPVVHYVEGQAGLRKKSGTMRLGAYDCELEKESLAFSLYKKPLISERHRHRYEINPAYLDRFAEKGLVVSGTNPESKLVEIMEMKQDLHPYFIATQFHPEFVSRLVSPSPVFDGLISAAIKLEESRNTKAI